ncbi:MAG: hypothetical protein OIF57_06065 [Marinobacterium sp.]|nr:hypothetical protein [Marinobacterium sp.]
MPAKKLVDYLNTNRTRYITLIHSPAWTAAEVAQAAHIRGNQLAKTVILDAGGAF